MEWYEAEVRELEKKIAAGRLIQPAVFYGSSTIRLWATLPEDLGSTNILNLGFGGSTLEACVFFFERLVVAAQPQSLVVYAGDNDLGDGKSPEQVTGFYLDLARKIEANLPGVGFGFISIKPSPARVGILNRIAQTNAAIAQDIAKRDNAYFIDVFPAMLDANGQPRRELFDEGGLHLNAQGYQVWTKAISEYRDRIIA